jgi:hypothetical protein
MTDLQVGALLGLVVGLAIGLLWGIAVERPAWRRRGSAALDAVAPAIYRAGREDGLREIANRDTGKTNG